MFVDLLNGRTKRVMLASLPCDYLEREVAFRQFVDNNPQLMKVSLHAEFVIRETVYL
jgi:hypothetical protein